MFKIAAKSLLSGKILLIDRRATIRLVLKVVYFLWTKNRARYGVYFSIPIAQPSDPKQGIKKFLRQFPSTLVPSLTFQIHPTSSRAVTWKFHTWIFTYHLPYSRSLCLITWQREAKLVCNIIYGTKVVGKRLSNFLIPCFGSGCVGEWRNIPQTVRVGDQEIYKF
jgi:hypothetical protein